MGFVLHMPEEFPFTRPLDGLCETYRTARNFYSSFTLEQRNGITSAHLHCPGSLQWLSDSLWDVCVKPPHLLRRIENLWISGPETDITFDDI